VFGSVKVFRRVLILRGVAAAHVAALQAQAQMHPAVAHFHALLANMNICSGYCDLVEVRTLRHGFSPLRFG
jgi:sulfite reductase beta subunit-like hemoprotein